MRKGDILFRVDITMTYREDAHITRISCMPQRVCDKVPHNNSKPIIRWFSGGVVGLLPRRAVRSGGSVGPHRRTMHARVANERDGDQSGEQVRDQRQCQHVSLDALHRPSGTWPSAPGKIPYRPVIDGASEPKSQSSSSSLQREPTAYWLRAEVNRATDGSGQSRQAFIGSATMCEQQNSQITSLCSVVTTDTGDGTGLGDATRPTA
ncbi:unnamed protein product [Soboliphyme baturini]|uniref:Uncharacterized protein n=1 Tax=Soboliphyme baturini TaxID=241478 RepID=A0A183ISN0_9BILA|nr:unnamed protein product [Soboliphyme baturini]